MGYQMRFLELISNGDSFFVDDSHRQIVARPGFSPGEWRLTFHINRQPAFSSERYYVEQNFLDRLRIFEPDLSRWIKVEPGDFQKRYVLGIEDD